MSNNYIIFQAYGSNQILAECRLALIQLLFRGAHKNSRVVLYTDNPAYFFKEFAAFDQHIVETLSPGIISEWKGDINFVHRLKIKMLLHFFSKYKGNVLYCDTDTCCEKDPSPLFHQIENGQLFMHMNEGLISNGSNIVNRKWKRFLSEASLQVNGKNITDITGINMWNAGVIGLNSDQSHLLKEVLDITDTIYPRFPKHTVEQFAFSYVFQKNSPVQHADDFIFHYWNLKEYRASLANFFDQHQTLPLDELMIKIQQVLPHRFIQQKTAYKKLSFYKKLFAKKWQMPTNL